MPRAAAALAGYADALDVVRRTVLHLQFAWDEASRAYRTAICDLPFAVGAGTPAARTFAHEAAAARATDFSRLRAEYAACLGLLDEAGDRAATSLRSLTDEVLPGAGGGPAAVERSAPETDAAVRGAVLDGLGLVVGQLAALRAESEAADACRLLELVVAGDVGALDQVATLLGGRVADPVFARALMARLTPERLNDVLAALAVPGAGGAGWERHRPTQRTAEVLAALGVALSTAANPERSRELDPATERRLTRWRGTWLQVVAASVGQLYPRADGTWVGGGWGQGQLLAGAARSGPGHSPGVLYVESVGVALVAAERLALARKPGPTSSIDATRLLATGSAGSTLDLGLDDVLLALEQTLRGDVAATRAFLLHPLPGEDDLLVVDHLVRDRFRLVADGRAGRSTALLGQLVVESGSDPHDFASMHLAARFLDAVGATALETGDLTGLRRALSPALYDVATVLGAHADALTDVLDGTAARGTDASLLPSGHRFVQNGRVPGTFDIVLRDEQTAAAVLGELALDRIDTSGPAADPARAPALVHVAQLLVEHQEGDLVSALGRDRDGDTHALDAAADRLGRTVGFVLASGGEALAGVQAGQDAYNAAVLSVADHVIAHIPAPPGAGEVGGLLMPYVRLAAGNAIGQLLPTDGEASQRAQTSSSLARAGDDVLMAARTLVSQTAPWTTDQWPQAWAVTTTRTVTPFWAADGRPRPETSMETAQLRSFNDWRRDVGLSVYDTTPRVVREAVAAGANEAVSSRTPRA